MAKEKDEESLVKCIYNDMVFYVPSDVFSIVLLRTQRYSTKKYVRYKEGAELYSMSERKFTDLANNSDAVVHVDKIALVDLEKVEEYIKLNNSEDSVRRFCRTKTLTCCRTKSIMRMVEGRYADLAKMGRPKAEKPKSSKISIRFTDEEFEQLKQRADQNDQTITETIREGVRLLFETKHK